MENHGIIIPTKDKLFNLEPLLTKTPGNIITWIILAIGLFITIIRFTVGNWLGYGSHRLSTVGLVDWL